MEYSTVGTEYAGQRLVNDRIREETTSTGDSGEYTLDGPPAGYCPFLSNDSYTIIYLVEDDVGHWEIGEGYVQFGVLHRTQLLSAWAAAPDYVSYSTPVTWGAGTKMVSLIKTATPLDIPETAENVCKGTSFLYAETSSATPKTMVWQSGMSQALAKFGVMHAVVHARSNDDVKGWELKAVFDGDGNLVGSATVTDIAATAGASSWSIATGNLIDGVRPRITVTGAASTDITWKATVVSTL